RLFTVPPIRVTLPFGSSGKSSNGSRFSRRAAGLGLFVAAGLVVSRGVTGATGPWSCAAESEEIPIISVSSGSVLRIFQPRIGCLISAVRLPELQLDAIQSRQTGTAGLASKLFNSGV